MDIESVILNNVDEYRNGMWRARVVNIYDPEKRGRIQISVLQLHDQLSDDHCPYAEPCFPIGGSTDQGAVMIPPVGATVWVQFEQGHVGKPVWLGGWYGRDELVTEVTGDAGTATDPASNYVIKTPGGQKLHFTDTEPIDNAERIEIALSAGLNKVLLEMGDTIKSALLQRGGQKVELLDSSGVKTTVLQHVSGTSHVQFNEATDTLEIKYPGGSLLIDGGSSTVTLDSDGDVDITGGDINIGGAAATEAAVLGAAFLVLYNAHTHSGVTTGGGVTGVPSALMIAGTHTSGTVNVKA